MVEQAVRSASEQIKLEYDAILHQQLCGMLVAANRGNIRLLTRLLSRQFRPVQYVHQVQPRLHLPANQAERVLVFVVTR